MRSVHVHMAPFPRWRMNWELVQTNLDEREDVNVYVTAGPAVRDTHAYLRGGAEMDRA